MARYKRCPEQSSHIVNPLCAPPAWPLLHWLSTVNPGPSKPAISFTGSIENFTLLLPGIRKTAFSTPSDRFAQTRSQLRAKTVKNANVAELIEADCFGPGAGSRQSQVFICHKSLFLLQNLSAKKPQLWELMTRMLAKISRWQLMQRIMTSETF